MSEIVFPPNFTRLLEQAFEAAFRVDGKEVTVRLVPKEEPKDERK